MAKAKFRMVHTAFWNDPTVSEEMTPEDKYFFLYLLTNEHTTQIGIYGISKKQMAFDTGYSIESINALMQRFMDHHKLIRYNPETREIAVKNWGKYNFNKGGKPVLDCVKSELQHVKDTDLIPYVGDNIFNEPVKAIYDSWYESLHDTSTTRGQEEEEEKEEEEKEEKEEKEEAVPPSPPPSSQIDESFLKIKTYFEQHMRPTTYRDAQDINKLLEYYKDADLIIEAFKIALDRGKPFINYIDGILKRWSIEHGINTYEDFIRKESQLNAGIRERGKQSNNDEYDGLSL
ncbi:DnaD domain protein [Lysinibacillus louembei]|uniref:DnaD domain protein n=1 Tax=Lysinibacillus louembei TaxID=1470088 RepID=A0ABZ0RZ41_9BACI|nr:DnaD domain protein [Lysinibacillus louembei]WPK12274.1 DnaD domain protein [Lysinibacillus louembei]